ncbi:MAG: tRNA-binding protein [Candidatus Micrarchaeia archaeon]
MASIEEFNKIELRIGKIVNVDDHPTARKPMYVLRLSFGELGERTVVAGIKGRYSKDELAGKKIVCVFNLEPKAVAGIESNGMLLAAEDGNTLALLTVDKDVKEGSLVH